jgi:hypothetical protein
MADRTPAAVAESIADAIAWLKFVSEVEKTQRTREDEDLAFQSADGAWPSEIKAARGPQPARDGLPASPAQPMISVASLDEPIALTAAQERKAHLGITIHALSEDATDDTAEVLTGLYRSIETDSRAQNVRSWSYQRSLWAGRGAYRVDKVYDPQGGHKFDQKLVLKRILYQSQVFLDPFAQNPDSCDGLRAMVIEDVPRSVYKRKYKKSKIAKLDGEALRELGTEFPEWVKASDEGTDDTCTIRIAEDWRVEITERKLVLLDDGSTAYEDEIPYGRKARTGTDARWRWEETRKVFWRVINCQEELEPEQEWDGQYIPIIPTIGRELQPVKGKREWMGIVANAKGAVRLTNYAASGAVKMAALEPRAPWLYDPKQIESFDKWWETSNTRDWWGLPYHAEVDGRQMPPPTRVQADTGRLGPNMMLLQMGRDFVQTATATYDPALGKQPTAHRSGRAIVALQDQSVEATSPYLDNLATVSMPYEAMVVLDLIPKVYDRPGRIARILDEQDRSSLVMLNAPYQLNPQTKRPQPMPEATPEQTQNPQHPAKHYDLSKGRYGVSVQIGKARPSRLAEGSDALSSLMQSDPQLVPILGPEWARFQDFPGADSVARLLTKMRDHTMPWLSDQQQPMDPQRLAAENQQLKAMLQQASQEKAGKVIENQGKAAIAQIQETAETQRAREANETKLAVAALGAKFETLANAMNLFMEERARLGSQQHDALMASGQHQSDAMLAELDNSHSLEQGAQSGEQALVQGAQPPPPAPTNGSGAA